MALRIAERFFLVIILSFFIILNILNIKEKAMIKITHVLTDSNIGGAGILLCNLFSELNRQDFDFRVILPKGAALSPLISALDIPVLEAEICPDRSFCFKDFFVFRRLLAENRPDILHTHGSFSARLAGRTLSVPHCILTRHCDTPVKMPTFIYNSISDLTVCTSMPLYEHMLTYGVPKEKLRFIINGAKPCARISESRKKELCALFDIPKSARVIGIVGRLEKIKGQELFLRAAQNVLRAKRNCVFLLVGDGSMRQELEALSYRLGISENVRFCGHRQDAGEIMNLFDIAVNSSFGSETSSLAISESLSLAIPVVASDIDGNGALLGTTPASLPVLTSLFPTVSSPALFFKRGDSVSLANALLYLLEHDTLRKIIGKNGNEHYKKNLTPSSMAKEYEKLYREIVEGRSFS